MNQTRGQVNEEWKTKNEETNKPNDPKLSHAAGDSRQLETFPANRKA